MEEKEGRLQIAGRISGLAPNEQIYSARFVGDRGYMVTYRQVDPLFVVDLSDPYNPELKASLKIPGFSEYMHPLGSDHLLTIGRDGTDDGQVLDTALQVFDVTDAADPKLIHKHVLPPGYSEAERNHKAFTFYQGKLAIPTYRYSYDGNYSFSSTLDLFKVDVSDGISPMGSVDHSSFFGDLTDPYCYPYSVSVRRGVFIDDYIYSISEGGVLVSPTADVNNPVASLAFAQPELDPSCYGNYN